MCYVFLFYLKNVRVFSVEISSTADHHHMQRFIAADIYLQKVKVAF